MRRVECETPSGSEASLVSPVNFLGKNGVLFIRHLIDSYGVNFAVATGVEALLCACLHPFFSLLACRMCSRFVSRRASHAYGTMKATKNSAEIRVKREATVAKHMTRRTFVAAACGAVAAAACAL